VQDAPVTGIPVHYGVAVTSPEHAARVARFGAGWLPIHTTTPDELRAGVAALHDALIEAGRDPKHFAVRAAAKVVWRDDDRVDVDATRAANAWLTDAGVTSASLGTGRNMRSRDGLVQYVRDALDAFAVL
jgi:alkanesulfonate monooxygenase SsuD/methylene tetrahydromethanopterin reductase-like flavin-dependent oxidoreductase (luciferase family)